MPWDEITSDHIRNFPFWDGDVEMCTYAARGWMGYDGEPGVDADIVAQPANWQPGFMPEYSTGASVNTFVSGGDYDAFSGAGIYSSTQCAASNWAKGTESDEIDTLDDTCNA